MSLLGNNPPFNVESWPGRGRTYDVVIWGGTGFTGALAVEYFAKEVSTRNPDVRWAIGGRNAEKLAAVASSAGATGADILVGDSDNSDGGLEKAVRSAKVVMSLVGPFALFGSKLVELCVKHKTHYCDITGEVGWVQEQIKLHHEQASADGTLIVPMW